VSDDDCSYQSICPYANRRCPLAHHLLSTARPQLWRSWTYIPGTSSRMLGCLCDLLHVVGHFTVSSPLEVRLPKLINPSNTVNSYNKRYLHHLGKHAPGAPPPETRLDCVLTASIVFAVSCWWMAWTAYPSISIWSTIMSMVLMGYGLIIIFSGCFAYLVS
jgi:hypothetical protein